MKSEEKADNPEEEIPLIAGLPLFYVHQETSLRMEPDHRSKVKIRLYPGMEVKILDPTHHRFWTKVQIGNRVGWAKKALLYPVSGKLDYSYLEQLHETTL